MEGREGSTEHLVTAARIFKVDEDAIRKALKHKEEKNRNNHGFFNTHGGNNRILMKSQEEAIFSYCFNQWEIRFRSNQENSILSYYLYSNI